MKTPHGHGHSILTYTPHRRRSTFVRKATVFALVSTLAAAIVLTLSLDHLWAQLIHALGEGAALAAMEAID